jgi:putative MFS transporter
MQAYEALQVDAEGQDARAYPPFLQKWLGESACEILLRKCTKRQWLVLSLLCVASMFAKYDIVIFGVCLKQIQESLHVADDEVSYMATIVRLGAIPAILANIAGDKLGRRTMLLFTLLPYTLFTLMTAFSTTKAMFTAFQFLSRIFIIAELTLSNCTIIEEFDDDNRGWAIGMLGAVSATGMGLGLVLFGVLGDYPWGWRAMFVVGVLPLVAVSWYRRSLPETRSYRMHAANLHNGDSNPIMLLFRTHPKRLFYASAFVFTFQFCSNVAGLYSFKFMEEVFAFTPSQVAILGVLGGFVAMNMYSIAGRMSDTHGRQRIAMALSSIFFIMLLGFYNSVHWAAAVFFWVAFMACEFGVSTVTSAYYSELFSTSHRSTAAGMYEVCSVVGLTVGTIVEAALYSSIGSHWQAITITSLPGMFACLLLRPLPETANMDLGLVSSEIMA